MLGKKCSKDHDFMEARVGTAEKVAMAGSRRAFWKRQWTFFDKRSACLMLFMHSLCIFAPFYFTWAAFWVGVFYYIVVGGFGVTLSYHRNLAHKSFKLPKWLEYLFAYFGTLALQGDPIDWVSTHRYHHRFVDTERDPHTPIQGFWFSHITWIMDSYALTKKVNPEYDGDFQEIRTNIWKASLKYGRPNNVSDLEEQLFYRIVQKTYWFHILPFAIAFYAVGGLPFLIWALVVAPTWGYHVTFMVNSVCHTWGKQPWNTHDLSKNNWLVALVTFGEGWHNNHHAFEYSARQGLEWWQLDFTWYVILSLQALGLATDVKVPSHKQKLAKAHQIPKTA